MHILTGTAYCLYRVNFFLYDGLGSPITVQSFIGLALMVPEIIRGVSKDPHLGALTLFRLGGGAQHAPYRFLSGCAKAACSRLMKLSDF